MYTNPFTFVSIIILRSDSFKSWIEARPFTNPALLTRISIFLKGIGSEAIAALIDTLDWISRVRMCIGSVGDVRWISVARDVRRDVLLEVRMSVLPYFANSFAHAAPRS